MVQSYPYLMIQSLTHKSWLKFYAIAHKLIPIICAALNQWYDFKNIELSVKYTQVEDVMNDETTSIQVKVKVKPNNSSYKRKKKEV